MVMGSVFEQSSSWKTSKEGFDRVRKKTQATRKTSKLLLSGNGRLLVARRWWAKDHQAEGVDIKSDHQQQRENVDREREHCKGRGGGEQTAQSKSERPVVKSTTHFQLRQLSCKAAQSASQKYIKWVFVSLIIAGDPHENNSNSLLFNKCLQVRETFTVGITYSKMPK